MKLLRCAHTSVFTFQDNVYKGKIYQGHCEGAGIL